MCVYYATLRKPSANSHRLRLWQTCVTFHRFYVIEMTNVFNMLSLYENQLQIVTGWCFYKHVLLFIDVMLWKCLSGMVNLCLRISYSDAYYKHTNSIKVGLYFLTPAIVQLGYDNIVLNSQIIVRTKLYTSYQSRCNPGLPAPY